MSDATSTLPPDCDRTDKQQQKAKKRRRQPDPDADYVVYMGMSPAPPTPRPETRGHEPSTSPGSTDADSTAAGAGAGAGVTGIGDVSGKQPTPASASQPGSASPPVPRGIPMSKGPKGASGPGSTAPSRRASSGSVSPSPRPTVAPSRRRTDSPPSRPTVSPSPHDTNSASPRASSRDTDSAAPHSIDPPSPPGKDSPFPRGHISASDTDSVSAGGTVSVSRTVKDSWPAPVSTRRTASPPSSRAEAPSSRSPKAPTPRGGKKPSASRGTVSRSSCGATSPSSRGAVSTAMRQVIDHNLYPDIVKAILERSPLSTILTFRAASRHYKDVIEDMLLHLQLVYEVEPWTRFDKSRRKVILRDEEILKVQTPSALLAIATNIGDLIDYQHGRHERLGFCKVEEAVQIARRICKIVRRPMTLDIVGLFPIPYSDRFLKPIFASLLPRAKKVKAVRYLPDRYGRICTFIPRGLEYYYFVNQHAAVTRFLNHKPGEGATPVYLIDGRDGPMIATAVQNSAAIIDFRPWRPENCVPLPRPNVPHVDVRSRIGQLLDVVGCALRTGHSVFIIGIEKVDLAWLDPDYLRVGDPADYEKAFREMLHFYPGVTKGHIDMLSFFDSGEQDEKMLLDFGVMNFSQRENVGKS